MTSVADYAGRTTDMLAFQGAFPSGGDRLLAQSLVGDRDGGSVVTGVEKLAQRVLLILLTKAGSMAYRPDDGTTFMRDADAGAWRTAADVELSFHAAKLDLVRQIRAVALDSDPADEVIDSIEFLGAALTDGAATLQLRVVSAAGVSVTFIAPISLVVR